VILLPQPAGIIGLHHLSFFLISEYFQCPTKGYIDLNYQ
jgi:hypothetical protein